MPSGPNVEPPPPIDFVFDSMVGFSGSADRVNLLPVDTIPGCDRQTDGRTDGQTSLL